MQVRRTNALLATSLALIAGVGTLAGCSRSGHPEGGMMGGGVPEVGVVTVTPQKVTLTSELAGRTSPYQIAEIRPQIGGIVLKRQFREGGDVKAGEALYQIDPAVYEATLHSAQAALAKAEANLSSARNKAERYKALVAIKGVSQQDYDDAEAAAKQGVADVASAKAALDTARINLAYTRVASPISGRIGKSSVTQGALVAAGQATALATVQQLDPIYVDVTQSSADLLRLKRELASGSLKSAGGGDASVGLLLEDGSRYPLRGKLQFSDVTVDQGTGTVTLRAIFPNPKGELLPGMYVRTQLDEGVDEQGILVPQQGVTRDEKGQPLAMVLGADGKVQPRILKLRQALGDKWVVSEGLKAGDKLIVDGLQKIRPGAPAKVAANKPAAAQR
ncbi:efflux RND transporter periplasmic adaptor subunit [Niveibacterium terrae]|uniref:efflux RND transporter periplasmic adaptor subunit n=1 Tax=Niveibacterium terrae TaxID=3373598 RepID=UPI003A8E2F1D